MKILTFTLLFLTFSVQAAISVLSDLDDTIKITEASGSIGDYLGDDVYTGMPEFLRGVRDYSKTLYVLSASPSFLRSKIQDDFRERKIKYNELILRNNVFEDKFIFKVREISKILDRTTDDFILIGDDWGKDPEVYAEIIKLYPGRILDAYIRVSVGRSIPREVIPFWTSFDLFLREHEADRMKSSRVKTAFRHILAEANLNYIFPKKADCPTEGSVWDWQAGTIFARESQKLTQLFTAFCLARQSVNILP